MPRTKNKRYEELTTFSHVIQKPNRLDAIWPFLFQNEKPLILELGCGHGNYTISLAVQFPHKYIIGIDMKGARIWKGAKIALTEQIPNAFFIRMPIQMLDTVFPKSSVDELWITFPDPFPKEKRAKHRLTHPAFLAKYHSILKDHGVMHFKTDDSSLFSYSIDMIESHPYFSLSEIIYDIYHTKHQNPFLDIQTSYEKKHLREGKTIYYLKAFKQCNTHNDSTCGVRGK